MKLKKTVLVLSLIAVAGAAAKAWLAYQDYKTTEEALAHD